MHPGMKVLTSRRRPGTRSWSLGSCEMAEVLRTGVPHEYRVTTGGWDSRTERRTTSQGIQLRVTRNSRGGRDGELLDVTYVTDTIAAYLLPAEGANLTEWQAAQDWISRIKASAAAGERDQQELAARFAAAFGIGISFDRNGHVVLNRDDARQLLNTWDAS